MSSSSAPARKSKKLNLTGRAAKSADIYSTLDKLLKAMQLYEGRGSLVDQLLGHLQQRVSAVVSEEPLTVQVTPAGLLYGNQPLSQDEPARYLFRLFCDGVRELTLLPGVQPEELYSLCEALMSDPGEGEDLVTELWKRQLQKVRYYAVDTLSENLGPEGDAQSYASSQLRSEDSGEELVLSSSDIHLLREEGRLSWMRDCAPLTILSASNQARYRSLREDGRLALDFPRFVQLSEAVALRSSSGSVIPSPMVLGVLDDAIRREDVALLAPLLTALSDASRPLIQAFFTEDRMSRLAPLYEGHHTQLADPLHGLLDHSNVVQGGVEQEALVALLKDLPDGPARSDLLARLREGGVDMTAFYLQQLSSEQTEEVVDAILALGKLGTPRAVKALGAALGNHLTDIRRAALQAISGRYSPEIRVALGRSLKDPDGENRLLALQIFKESGDRRLGGALLSAIRDDNFYTKPIEEQRAFFASLAILADERTLSYLTTVLQNKNLTRSRAVIERQLLAIEALRLMGSDTARSVLQQCQRSWYLPAQIKQASEKALRKGS